MNLTLPDDPKALETLYDEIAAFLYEQDPRRSPAYWRNAAVRVIDFLGRREEVLDRFIKDRG